MRRYWPLLVLSGLVWSAPAPGEALPVKPSEADSEIVKTASDAAQRMTVPVSIGDKGPFRFLIDTGAQSTILSEHTARDLALTPSGRINVLGVAGTREVGIVALEDIRLGSRIWHGRQIPLLAGEDLGADGVVGLDGLQNQRVLLDFAANRMVLVEASDPALRQRDYDIVVTARRQRGQLILTQAVIDDVRVDVVIDTGADVSVANPALQRALAQEHGRLTTTLRSATGQEIAADVGLARQITIEAIRINNIQLAFANSPTFKALGLERRPALLLGMEALRLFKRVAIDFPRHRIMFAMPPGTLPPS